ncbi:lipopolysaccharide biosynthesis protein [Vibrio litoralis]|uniref:lipopolysaccharide biosynthesis protein n=1 Tax=Vibrio litoralis TaxID=335972 RepID=UPI00041224A2|nr:oligosaccharide flippase family protein [Vibrio litoralis]
MINVKSTFFKNVLVIFSGTALAQILNILSTPLITRLYGPEAFGVLGTFNALASIFIPVISLAYVYAIPIPKYNFISRNIAIKSFFIVVILSVISLLLLLFNELVMDLFDVPIGFVIFIPLMFFLSGMLQINQQILIRFGLFSTFAKATIISSITVIIFKLITGWLDPQANYLIIGALIGVVTQILSSLYFNKFFWNKYTHDVSISKVKLIFVSPSLKKYSDFPKFRTPQLLLNPLSRSLPVFFLTSNFGLGVVGYYTLATSMLALPAVVIGNAVGNVFLKKVTHEINNGNDVLKLVVKSTLLLAGIGIVPFGFVFFYGDILFTVFLGKEWTQAGVFASYIAIWQFFGFANKCCNVTLPVIGMNKFYLKYEVISLILRVLLLFACSLLTLSSVDYVLCFSILGAFLNLFLIIKVILMLRNIPKVV